ncbi:hypothetical protein HOY82DRAFT_255528 [Tuber indicum]|nr:hypothetical protein HOY82DRAFT_255528 [Tuber indicum]
MGVVLLSQKYLWNTVMEGYDISVPHRRNSDFETPRVIFTVSQISFPLVPASIGRTVLNLLKNASYRYLNYKCRYSTAATVVVSCLIRCMWCMIPTPALCILIQLRYCQYIHPNNRERTNSQNPTSAPLSAGFTKFWGVFFLALILSQGVIIFTTQLLQP